MYWCSCLSGSTSKSYTLTMFLQTVLFLLKDEFKNQVEEIYKNDSLIGGISQIIAKARIYRWIHISWSAGSFSHFLSSSPFVNANLFPPHPPHASVRSFLLRLLPSDPLLPRCCSPPNFPFQSFILSLPLFLSLSIWCLSMSINQCSSTMTKTTPQRRAASLFLSVVPIFLK